MKLNSGLYFLGIVILIYFAWTQVRPSIVRSSCYNEAYQSRTNENNYKWAEGKGWHPTEIDGVGGAYQWIYYDQSSLYSSQNAKKEREQRQAKNYDLCLLKKGLRI